MFTPHSLILQPSLIHWSQLACMCHLRSCFTDCVLCAGPCIWITWACWQLWAWPCFVASPCTLFTWPVTPSLTVMSDPPTRWEEPRIGHVVMIHQMDRIYEIVVMCVMNKTHDTIITDVKLNCWNLLNDSFIMCQYNVYCLLFKWLFEPTSFHGSIQVAPVPCHGYPGRVPRSPWFLCGCSLQRDSQVRPATVNRAYTVVAEG